MVAEGRRVLDPNDFSFYGFEEAMKQLRRQILSVGVRGGEPKVSVVENGIFVPVESNQTQIAKQEQKRGSAKIKHIAGIVDAAGRPVEAMQLRRAGKTFRTGLPQPVVVEPQAELDEEVVCMGWLFGQFGHVLLESLARIWFLGQVDPSVPVVFQNGPPPAESVAFRLLEAFGVPKDRVLVLDRPTRMRRAFIPEPLYELRYEAHERAAEPHRAVAERILAEASAGTSEQPVYLSRRLLLGHRRIVVGEDELEDVLRENGFVIAHPELMTLEDQIRLLNRHQDIFACEGSAVHGALFALGSPRLHILAPADIAADYFLSSTIAGARATFINCLSTGAHRNPNRLFPHLADAPKLVEYLEAQGFLKTRYRAAIVAGNPHRPEDRYEEAWFFMRVNLAVSSGEALSADDATEAERLARASWPLSAMLARYFATHDPARVDGLVMQFLELLADESSIDRMARYGRDIAAVIARIDNLCEPATAARLAEARSSRFSSSYTEESKPRQLYPERDASARDRRRRTRAQGPGRDDALPFPQSETPARPQPVLITSLDRVHLLSMLPKGGDVAEVGVFEGKYSAQILRAVKPDRLHLIDPWGLNDQANLEYTTASLAEAYDQVQSLFDRQIAVGRVMLYRDFSTAAAATFPDHYFDWIYIDAKHDYENVRADLMAFKDKVKPEGFILGHDYSNNRNPTFFGVIPAVREFTRSEGFELVLVTNEANPSYLLARSGNETTLSALKETLHSHRTCSVVQVAESLFDRFALIRVPVPTRKKGRTLMRFG